MAKEADPLQSWRLSVQPSKAAQAGFDSLLKLFQPLSGHWLLGQLQKFPPRYTLDIKPAVMLHQGKRFATLCAVSGSIYLELCPWDDALQQKIQKELKIKPPGYEGYAFRKIDGQTWEKLETIVQGAFLRLQKKEKADTALLGGKKVSHSFQYVLPQREVSIPDYKVWTSPISWVGSSCQPSDDFSRRIPENACFTRGEVLLTLYRNRGPGVQEQTEKTLPALLQLEKTKRGTLRLIAAHAIGFDGQAWTYRLAQQGKQEYMPLFVGKSFKKQSPASAELLSKFQFAHITIQSILSAENGQAICVSLLQNFEVTYQDLEEDDDD